MMTEFSPATQEAFKALFIALEKQYGPIEYVTMCHSFEDSPEFQRIAGIGLTTGCEISGCTNLSVNCCCFCDRALCQEDSFSAISDEGYDAYACAYCSQT